MEALYSVGTYAATRAAHGIRETDDEKEFRKQAKFPDCEAKISLPLLSRRHVSWMDQIMSIFGSFNPFAKEVDPKLNSVWLLDNTAGRLSSDKPWQAKFTAAYFKRNSGEDLSKAVACIAGLLGHTQDEEKKKTIAERVEPFLDTILPAHYCSIQIGGADQTDQRSTLIQRLPPSNLNGISSTVFQIPGAHFDGDTITSRAVDVAYATPCTTTFATIDGWAVISDIDDTIKKTKTASPTGILSTTFVEAPEAIAGMPEFYAHLREKLHNPPFWYVSASPYNLYPFLHSFREKHYPAGPLLLRETSMMNLGAFLLSLTAGVKEYKTTRMRAINAAFPRRRMVCIGDSTQSDPEAYAEMYHAFKGWVAAIFIRKVTDVSEMNESGKNSPERFEKAFKDVPPNIWYVFEDPKELYPQLDRIMSGTGVAEQQQEQR